MGWVSAIAIFFIMWWFVLFLVLPFGVRSQVEADDITLGTEHGAPIKASMLKKMALTTLVAAIMFAIFYLVTVKMGFGIDDLPRIVPDFSHGAPHKN